MNQGEDNTDKTKKITGISVCICTYRRPIKLKYLLEHLVDQISDLEIKAEIIIVDNDYQQSAKDVVEKIGNKILYKYLCEPIKNISLARNKAVRTAQYDFIALIDDDEYPSSDWLKNFISFYKLYPCHGVLGPVRPIFETEPPAWISESSLFQRPEFKSGTRLKPEHMRTGNAFIMKELFYLDDNPFDPNLGLTGGEDVDFFRRMFRRGYKFLWCNEAEVYEFIPSTRMSLNYQLSRALSRGLAQSRMRPVKYISLAKSCLALGSYLIILPFSALFGISRFNTYLIRLFDHIGKILGYLKLNPIKNRPE